MHVLTCRFFHIKRWSVLGVFLYQYAVLSPAVLTQNVAGTARQGRLHLLLLSTLREIAVAQLQADLLQGHDDATT